MATTSASTSPTLRRLALAAIVTNVGIVLTGGVVRLSGSGLGCPDWPTCDGTSLIPPAGSEHGVNQLIEFGNRTLTFLVLAVAVAVWVAARRQEPGDPVTVRLAAILPAGVVAQAVLGGVTVLTGLHPLWVAAHFLVSMVLVAGAVAVHHRVSGRPVDPDAATDPRWRRLAGVLVALAAVVLVLGTVVTGAGPHAGDPGTPRLVLDIRSVARLHAGAVWLLVATTVAALWHGRSAADDRPGLTPVGRAAAVLLAVELVQGGIGYAQYFLGVPEVLVALHLLGASLLWIAVLRVYLLVQPPGSPPVPAGSIEAREPVLR